MSNWLENSRGAALLELAICGYLLVILGFGMIDYSLGLEEHAAMRDAAQAGALAGARLKTANAQDITDVAASVAADFLTRAGFTPANYLIGISGVKLSGTTDAAVVVTITRCAVVIGWRWLALPSSASSSFRTNSTLLPPNLIPAGGC